MKLKPYSFFNFSLSHTHTDSPLSSSTSSVSLHLLVLSYVFMLSPSYLHHSRRPVFIIIAIQSFSFFFCHLPLAFFLVCTKGVSLQQIGVKSVDPDQKRKPSPKSVRLVCNSLFSISFRAIFFQSASRHV